MRADRPGQRRPISTGHPGFVLTPIVIGPDSTPAPGGQVSAELTVLAVLTGALDLGDVETRRLVLQAIAPLDAERREIYTRLIRATASTAVRRVLEELMATVFRDEFVDGLLDQGRAEGEAVMLLRVLAARGFAVPDEIRQLIQSCKDLTQIEAWGDRAATAESLEDVFTA